MISGLENQFRDRACGRCGKIVQKLLSLQGGFGSNPLVSDDSMIIAEESGPSSSEKNLEVRTTPRVTRAIAGRYLLLAAFFCLFSIPQSASAACGYDLVEVEGDDEEIAVACDMLDRVLVYFSDAGYVIEPHVVISFQDEVWFYYDPRAGRRIKVSGSFNNRTKTIEITRWKAEPRTERRPWGLDWDKLIVGSILQHELVHMATTAVLGAHQSRLGGAWHEFVAYAIQFELMEPEMRDRILADHVTIMPFETPWAISELTYAAEPDAFGLRAYLYAQARGGTEFIKNILENEVEIGTGDASHIYP